MSKNNPYWMFPSCNHGEEHGFADSLLEYFQGDHERYVAREAIQNAVDARLDSNKPVKVVFEYLKLKTKDIPGLDDLREVLKKCVLFVKGQEKAEKFFKAAINLLKEDQIPVLKISDFNTKGLFGADDDRDGNWYRLVRAAGTSSAKGPAGGSFGIGKGAPFAASALRTVFYSTINDQEQAVFQGKARLVSHYGSKKDVCQGVGFFGVDGYKAIRKSSLIPDFFSRNERGTDIFIIGYISDESWKSDLINSVLHNFWLTIHADFLEVLIVEGEHKQTINKQNLKDVISGSGAKDASIYFDAFTNPTQLFEERLPVLGNVKLFVKKADGYPSKVMYARQPRMYVDDRGYKVLREPYAGVFLCDDPVGNKLLRELEPPAHDKWDKMRDKKNGQAIISELHSFIKTKLRSMAEINTDAFEDIPGLSQYLPETDEESIAKTTQSAAKETAEITEKESGREVGRPQDPLAKPAQVISGKITAKTFVQGKGMQGKGKKKTTGGGTGPGKTGGGIDEGEGVSERINTSDIRFRSFVSSGAAGYEYRFIIESIKDCKGGIRIIGCGDDGNYGIDVISAVDVETKKEYEVSGSLIKNLELAKNSTKALVVKILSKRKYALGIEEYESQL